jgi:hypothetical protein
MKTWFCGDGAGDKGKSEQQESEHGVKPAGYLFPPLI